MEYYRVKITYKQIITTKNYLYFRRFSQSGNLNRHMRVHGTNQNNGNNNGNGNWGAHMTAVVDAVISLVVGRQIFDFLLNYVFSTA